MLVLVTRLEEAVVIQVVEAIQKVGVARSEGVAGREEVGEEASFQKVRVATEAEVKVD